MLPRGIGVFLLRGVDGETPRGLELVNNAPVFGRIDLANRRFTLDVAAIDPEDSSRSITGHLEGTIDNVPPVARSNTSDVECSATTALKPALLDGFASTDSDPGDAVVFYQWFSANGAPVGNQGAVTVLLPLGVPTRYRLHAYDTSLGSSQTEVTVRVVDTRPPRFLVPAGITVEQQSRDGSVVTLPAIQASDDCDPAPQITVNAPTVFPLGRTLVSFSASDASGNVAGGAFAVTVVDRTPPTVVAVGVPGELWPPNHKMVPVEIRVNAADVCDAAPMCKVVAIASAEPGAADDARIVGDLSVELRAERLGSGQGRTYNVRVVCTDASGNQGAGTAVVTVPHDQRP